MNGIPRVFRGVLSTKTPDNRHHDIFRFVQRRNVVFRHAKQQARSRQKATRPK